MRPFNNLENNVPSDIYPRTQLVCMKVLVHISFKPPLEYNQDQIKVSFDLFNQLGSYKKFMQFQMSPR